MHHAVETGPDVVAHYAWDRIVRGTHWGVAASMLVLAITGIYIGHPFIEVSGQARASFVMGWAKVIHFYAAIVFTLSVVARVVWLFRGPRRSGWRNFVPIARRRRRDLWKTLKYYLLIRVSPPRTIGHNPLAGLSYLGVFALYFVMIATGFALYAVSDDGVLRHFQVLLPLLHGVQGARWLHHGVMWVLIAFFVAHVFFAMLTSRSERTGTLDSMFSGYKFLPRDQPPDDADVDLDE